ncbi:Protein patched 1 [Cichlidogyrus casuarinus]|uniref:Protein patched 1 n=1 Tax=Cichlidogyrus casuarinus TaxID=1844966 RepID=A0ABD2PJP2_9PLAT
MGAFCASYLLNVVATFACFGLSAISFESVPINAFGSHCLPLLAFISSLDAIHHMGVSLSLHPHSGKAVAPRFVSRHGAKLIFNDLLLVAALLSVSLFPSTGLCLFAYLACLVCFVQLISTLVVLPALWNVILCTCEEQKLSARRVSSASVPHKCIVPLVTGFVFALVLLPFMIILRPFDRSFFDRLPLGIQLTDLIPYNSRDAHFYRDFDLQFGIYPFQTLTLGLADKYPETWIHIPGKQRQLLDAHAQIVDSGKAMLTANNKFWLAEFISWARGLQEAFQIAVNQGHIASNASWRSDLDPDALLALRLLTNADHLHTNHVRLYLLICGHTQ